MQKFRQIKKLSFGISLVLLLGLLVNSCNPKEPPAPYRYENNPTYTWGFAQFYGDYYANYGIENNVLSLQLFTDKFFLNNEGELEGYGQYLIIEDIFIAANDTLLPSGTYTANESNEAFSFLPGKKFKSGHNDISSGAYIYFIEIDPLRSKITYITDGNFTISQFNQTNYQIDFDFTLDGKENIKGSFAGELIHLDSTTTPSDTARKGIKKLTLKNSQFIK